MGLPPNTKTTKTLQTFATVNRTMDLQLSDIFCYQPWEKFLQATLENQILTAYQMFEWADKNFEGIKYFYVNNNDVKTSADAYKLVAQFSSSKTICGTQFCSHV